MNLIGYFNAFHVVTQEAGLSANARSLYFAILGEFNRAGYPAELRLSNGYVQNLSGIRSTHSFNTARIALIERGVIEHKSQVYRLKEVTGQTNGYSREIERKTNGNLAENEGKTPLVTPGSINNVEKEKDLEKKENENARASSEILMTWYKYKGEKLIAGKLYGFTELEKRYGAEVIINAIKISSEKNNYAKFPFVTYQFFKIILEKERRGENSKKIYKNVESEDWENKKFLNFLYEDSIKEVTQ